MWATLAFAAALSMTPGQQTGGPLKLTNPRATYGFLGPTRPTDQLLPGDFYYLHFDIENLSVDEQGTGKFKIGMQLTNDKGKVEFESDPEEKTAVNSLGGNRTPAFATVQIGTDTKPGKYILKVMVTDPKTKKTEELTRNFEVLPKAFGVVHVHMTYLQAPVPAPPSLVVGETILINSAIVGFDRNKEKPPQPSIGIEIVVTDEAGKPTLSKPFTDQVAKDVPEMLTAIPISLPLTLNRPGKFTIELKVTDRITKKDYSVKLPIQVQEQK